LKHTIYYYLSVCVEGPSTPLVLMNGSCVDGSMSLNIEVNS